jgi:hypothetical protein
MKPVSHRPFSIWHTALAVAMLGILLIAVPISASHTHADETGSDSCPICRLKDTSAYLIPENFTDVCVLAPDQNARVEVLDSPQFDAFRFYYVYPHAPPAIAPNA